MTLHSPRPAAAEPVRPAPVSPALVRPRLVHSSDDMPGIRRRRCGKGFAYTDADGKPLSCAETRARVLSLAVPPAWQDVWICADPNGHIQATGIDARGRKQYRYHPDWSEWRSGVKFSQLPEFGLALPRIRRRMERDLRAEPGSPEFAIAALILLLDRAHLRIGSRRHTTASGTYGATTLLARHVRLARDGTVRLSFRAKGGKRVQRSLRDKRLHKVLQEIDDLPGKNLFTWMDDEGGAHPVTSGQVNDWLADAAGGIDATAKTFRTWAGSVSALRAAAAMSRAGERLTVKALTEAAAERLHNTPAICRKSYIHPDILTLVELSPEDLLAILPPRAPGVPRGLASDERRLLDFLARQTLGGQRK
ncbi:DNA topoisomerase IB [Halodurantibacterium flavum]|uniref:DNA topoisomerase n=1 Tax=Halodurantibacterium flavum TaxID=1382802 RepID=A0ABW4S4P8_9RHOB